MVLRRSAYLFLLTAHIQLVLKRIVIFIDHYYSCNVHVNVINKIYYDKICQIKFELY